VSESAGPVTVTSSVEGFETAFEFASMSGSEEVSQLFHYEVELLSRKVNIPVEKMVGSTLDVHLALKGGGLRHFNGYVMAFSLRGVRGDHFVFAVTLRPWLYLLSHRVNCCIHRGTAVDIVKALCNKYGSLCALEFEMADSDRELPNYEFVVQYRESDLNFVMRILERDGLYFYFTHEPKKHEMLVTNGARLKVPGLDAIEFHPPDANVEATRESMEDWRPHFAFTPERLETTDYDFQSSKLNDLFVRQGSAPAQVIHGIDVYDYPGGYLDPTIGQDLAKRRLQTLQVQGARFEGETNVRGVTAGQVFTLQGHPQGGLNIEYFVHSVQFNIVSHALTSSSAIAAHGDVLRATVVALHGEAPFFPPLRALKPVMSGVQTAIVVGGKPPAAPASNGPTAAAPPPPQEVDIDEYGRIKVRFHWDRDPDQTGQNSCRVRVSQGWAGSNFGAEFHPRIGQEVIVDFVDGDPDQPIIVGRVHNFENKPAYTSLSQGGIKTQSTPDGDIKAFNEIRFEDKVGAEELFIQAQKTQTTNVKGSQSISVGGDRSVSVKGGETINVTKARKIFVDQEVEETYKTTHKITVTASQTQHAKTQEFKAPNGIWLIQSGETNAILRDGDVLVNAAGAVRLDAGLQVALVRGSTTAVVDTNAITLDAPTEVRLEVGETFISIKSGVVTIDSSDKVSVTGKGPVSVNGATVTVKGDTVNVEGQTVSVQGGTVNLNA